MGTQLTTQQTILEHVRIGLLALAQAEMARRAPDFAIGPTEDPYLLRWHLAKSETEASVYIHKILRSDDDRALHDHRGDNVSILLCGEYREVVPIRIIERPADAQFTVTMTRREGEIIQSRAEDAHRLVIQPGFHVITLFITAPTRRQWGFWCPQGWKHWRDFVAKDNAGAVGPGCGD